LLAEYGDATKRPHYHLLVFGLDFRSDRYLWRKSAAGYLLYRSPTLEEIWPFGHCEIGDVTAQSAGYVSRYILSKVTGKAAEDHYRRVHPVTGECVNVQPEFIVMSRKPGIGAEWYSKFSADCFPSNFVIVDGDKRPIPRFYQKKLAAQAERDGVGHSLGFSDAKRMQFDMHAQKLKHAKQHAADNTQRRLDDRREVVESRIERLRRDEI